MRKLLLLLITIMALVTACQKDNADNTPAGKAILVFPTKDALCTTGSNITATQSTITFSWNTSDHTNGYEITVKNLVTNAVTTKVTSSNQIAITLDANAPYTWHIKSVSAVSPDGVLSDEWRFYNAGLGITSYAPFPATMVAPTYGQAVTAVGGKVTLSWTGNDVDNDVATYTMYCDKNTTPLEQPTASSTATTYNMAVTSGTYYWYVVTTDKQGNTSRSETYKFTVN